ncbi:MAG: pitrilysin family protein [Patescibacteria group bacterium]
MYKKTIFKNGIRLVAAPLKETQTATILVLFKVGSRYENKGNNGISHFIEHMMFKGTKKRPTTLDLSKALDGVGAEFNAFTGKDYTGYYVKSDNKHLSLAIDVLSDMLTSSKFDEKEINREKGVIVEEINMYEDNPIMFVEDLLEQIMFGKNPLGSSIAGTRKSVRGSSRRKMMSYWQKFYQGKNIVIGLAGNFNTVHLKEIEKKFVFSSGQAKNIFKVAKSKQKSPRVMVRHKETEQVQLAIGFPAYSYANKKIYALQVLNVILGGNMSSRLFLQVRERNGLAYAIRSWLNVYEDTGGLIIQAGLDKIRIEKAIGLIMDELRKVKKSVKTEEIRRAKDYLAGKLAIDLEDSSSLSQWYGQQELLTGKILTPEEKIKKVMAVTLKDIQQAAKEVINFKKLNLAIIGPFKNEDKFLKLIQK